MKKSEFQELMESVFDKEINKLREAGQKEYAGGDDSDAFTNFIKLAEETDIDRKKVLWIHAMKHKDGIAAYLRGHVSQREDVRGRINDLIVYLFLLRGMIDEEAIAPIAPVKLYTKSAADRIAKEYVKATIEETKPFHEPKGY